MQHSRKKDEDEAIIEGFLDKLRADNPDASPQELMEAFADTRDKRFVEVVLYNAFYHLWDKGIIGPDSTDADVRTAMLATVCDDMPDKQNPEQAVRAAIDALEALSIESIVQAGSEQRRKLYALCLHWKKLSYPNNWTHLDN